MALREFTDEQGRWWLVCDVRPSYIERRSGAERRRAPRPGSPERRQQRQHRMTVPPHFRGGWLVFDTRGERRRLAPIPQGWECCDEPQLQRLLRDAEVLASRG